MGVASVGISTSGQGTARKLDSAATETVTDVDSAEPEK